MAQETVSHRGGSQAVRAARRDEAALLGELFADAFAEDPVFAWLIPPQLRDRDNRMRTFFTSMSRSYLRRGKPCYLTGDAAAAALWAAPGTWAMPLSQVILEAVPNGLALRRRLFRALRTQLQIERLHAGQSAPHWYLGYLGTRRGRQGQGLGSQLLREVLAGADTAGVPRPTSNPPTSATCRCMSAMASASSANYRPWATGPPSGVCGASPTRA